MNHVCNTNGVRVGYPSSRKYCYVETLKGGGQFYRLHKSGFARTLGGLKRVFFYEDIIDECTLFTCSCTCGKTSFQNTMEMESKLLMQRLYN